MTLTPGARLGPYEVHSLPGAGGMGQAFPAATGIALRYLDAGDHERVIAWLQKGYDQQDPGMPYTNGAPFDRLRDDPRYQALRLRIGISIPTT